jgi:hypothetical protein
VNDENVKDLLGRAFGQEPPLGIDREVVLQQGRKRLRRKRFFEAGSVVAAVVVAAVGAATLTNLADSSEQNRIPPAASSSQQAPPVPNLPVTTTTTEYPPPSAPTTEQPRASHSGDAKLLTQALYESGILSYDEAVALPGQSGRPEFTNYNGQYTYQADIVRSSGLEGDVQVIVDARSAGTNTCPGSTADTDCESIVVSGVRVYLGTYQGADGERSVFGSATVSGIWVNISATNLTVEKRQHGIQPPPTPPVLSKQELCELAVKVGRSAG